MMEKLVDVIIPAYNAHDTICSTLDSICYQTMAEKLSVYIMDDKSDKDYEDIVNKYKKYLDIKTIRLDENSGPGTAREVGIMNSTSKYIVFADSDDYFACPNAIEYLYNEISKKDLDLVSSVFMEMGKDDSYRHEIDEVYLHGKIYKREFLMDNNIHFNDIRTNEDNYYNTCIYLCEPKRNYLDYVTYCWDYNPNSITRRNNHEFSLSGVYSYIESITKAIEFGINNNKNKSIIAERSFGALNAIYYYYLEFGKDDFLKYAKVLRNYYMDNKENFKYQKDLYKSQLGYSLMKYDLEMIIKPSITFGEFLDKAGE